MYSIILNIDEDIPKMEEYKRKEMRRYIYICLCLKMFYPILWQFTATFRFIQPQKYPDVVHIES